MAHTHLYINMIRDALQTPDDFALIFSTDIFNTAIEDRQYIFSNLTPNEVEQLFIILSEYIHEVRNIRYQNFMTKIIIMYPHLNIARYLTNLMQFHHHTFDLAVHIHTIISHAVIQPEYLDIITGYYSLRLQLNDYWDTVINAVMRSLDIERKVEDVELTELTALQLYDYLTKADNITLLNIGKRYNMLVWFRRGMNYYPLSHRLSDAHVDILETETNDIPIFKIATPNSWK